MIVATAFGRQINVQRGESDEFSKAMDTAMKGFASGQFENFTLIHSMHILSGSHRYNIIRHTLLKSEILLVSLVDIKFSAYRYYYGS